METKTEAKIKNNGLTEKIKGLYLNGFSYSDIQKALLLNDNIHSNIHTIRQIVYRLIKQGITKPEAKTETHNPILKILRQHPEATAEATQKPEATTEDIKHLIPKNNGYIDAQKHAEAVIKGHLEFNSKIETGTAEKLNFLFLGETGTGKTQCAEFIAHKLNLPLWEYTFNNETTTEELLGYKDLVLTPSGDVTTQWIDGVMTKAFRNGGVLVLNEINTCNAGVSIKFFTALEKSRFIKLSDNRGEIIKGHNDLIIIGTMNEGTAYKGTNEQNIALASRLNSKRVFIYDKKTEMSLLKKGLIYNEKLLELAEQQRKAYFNETSEYSIPISTRDLILLTTQIKVYGLSEALEGFFINNFRKLEERKAIKELCEYYLTEKKEGVKQ